jgi:hypothetical protein
MTLALIGAIVLGALSTLYDFIWAHFEVRHRAVYGLVHGMTLLSAAGLVLAWPARRYAAGLIGGAIAGLVAAASFYAFYLVFGYLGGILAAWMLLWLLFGTLEARLRGEQPGRHSLVRGLAAALLSAAAFYLVSGIWTDHSGPPNYLRNFASWTFAFFPGFAALLWRRGQTRRHGGAEAPPARHVPS